MNSQQMEGMRVATHEFFDETKIEEFKDMLEQCFRLEEDAYQMQTNMTNSIRSVPRRMLGVSSEMSTTRKSLGGGTTTYKPKCNSRKDVFLKLMSCPKGTK